MTLTTVTAPQICFGLKKVNELTLLSYLFYQQSPPVHDESWILRVRHRRQLISVSRLSLSVIKDLFVETEEEQLSKQDDCFALHWSIRCRFYTAAGRRNDWIDWSDRQTWMAADNRDRVVVGQARNICKDFIPINFLHQTISSSS